MSLPWIPPALRPMRVKQFWLMLIVGSGIGLLDGTWWEIIIAQFLVGAIEWVERYAIRISFRQPT